MARKSDINISVGADTRDFSTAMQNLTREVQSVSGQLQKGFGGVGSIIKGVFAAGVITDFASSVGSVINQSVKLAMEAEGVRAAFMRLNHPGLLKELREATSGLITDLDLMKLAVRGGQFQIPLEQMASLLKFAGSRARDTGADVRNLATDIIEGIGKNSIEKLDNLGISAVRIKTAFSETKDMASAVGTVITEEMEKAGESTLTVADQFERLKVKLKNESTEMGNNFLPILSGLASFAEFSLNKINMSFALSKLWIKGFWLDTLETFISLSKAIQKIPLIGGTVTGFGLQAYFEGLRANLLRPDEVKPLKEAAEAIAKIGGADEVTPKAGKVEKFTPPKNRFKEFKLASNEIKEVARDIALTVDQLDIQAKRTDGIFENWVRGFNLGATRMAEEADRLNQQISAAIEDLVQNTLVGIGEKIGEAMTGNADAFDNFGLQMLDALGRFLKQIGAAFIVYGTAFEAVLKSMNPAVAIAAGITMVAAGAAISKMAQRGLSSSGGGSGGSSVSGGGGFSQGQAISLSAVLRGRDIYLIGQSQDYLLRRGG